MTSTPQIEAGLIAAARALAEQGHGPETVREELTTGERLDAAAAMIEAAAEFDDTGFLAEIVTEMGDSDFRTFMIHMALIAGSGEVHPDIANPVLDAILDWSWHWIGEAIEAYLPACCGEDPELDYDIEGAFA